MKRKLVAFLAVAVLGFVIGIPALAHADEAPAAIPAGDYTVALPGGGTLGFTVDASGNVTITMLPDGTTLASGPTMTDEGFKVTLTNGTTPSVVEVEVESEDGQLTVKAEQDVEDSQGQVQGQDQSSSNDNQVSGDSSGSGSGEGDHLQSPEPTAEPTVSSDGGDHSVSDSASPSPESSSSPSND